MRSMREVRRRAIVPILGVAIGITAALATTNWSAAVAGDVADHPAAVFEATHLPPLLTLEGERVELEYGVHCAPGGLDADVACDVEGTVFVRAGGQRSFSPFRLNERSENGLRYLTAVLPDELAASRGIEYYALLEAPALGRRLLVPAGGAEAPHVSRRLEDPVRVDLGRHSFTGHTLAGRRVAAADWGSGAGKVGLEQGRNVTPIGASAFDVDARGNVLILDEAHRRLLRWRPGANAPEHVPLSINGTLADLATADDGSLFVLETSSPLGHDQLVRRFDASGSELETIAVSERGSSQIRLEPNGPTVLGASSHQWLPVIVDGVPASPREQAVHGRAGRGSRGGVETVVIRRENEIRIATVSGEAVTRAWWLTSETPLAEVQLAEPFGKRMLLVVRAYEEALGDAFLVLLLDRDGLVHRFAVDSMDWAETAPLGRFKLVGRSLYRLGSNQERAFVDRFDLEVR